MPAKRKNKSITGNSKRLATRIINSEQRQLRSSAITGVPHVDGCLDGWNDLSEIALSSEDLDDVSNTSENLVQVLQQTCVNTTRRRKKTSKRNIARSNLLLSDVEEHKVEKMELICSECKGTYFAEEKTTRGTYNQCCHNGRVKLESPRALPPFLASLFTRSHPMSTNFFEHIRNYNSALSFASFGAEISPPPNTGPYSFRIHGQIYHRTSSIHPTGNQQPKYAQLYVLDSQIALQQRLNLPENSGCNSEIIKMLDLELRAVNPFAHAYKMLAEVEKNIISLHGSEAASNIRMYINDTTPTDQNHKGRFNAPTCNEVAMIFVSSDGDPPSNADICVHPRGQKIFRINSLNPNCDPMSYALFFPYGEKGFKCTDPCTQLQLYSYRIHQRFNEFNSVLHGGKLFQQFLVDCYCKVEGSRLQWFRLHQRELRVESYLGLIEFVNSEASKAGVKAGNITILPSTFTCGPRAMNQNYQDAMSIVQKYGKPDLFCTITCNTKWKAIIQNLLPGQTASDRPDLVARVFDIKKKAILKELIKDGILGKVIAFVYCIEYQKRGLPHCHLLLFLSDEDKIRDGDDIDLCVSAEIPDPDKDIELFNIVKSFMVHGPCGPINKEAPCMQNGECTKGYPKPFSDVTLDNKNGYPVYKRPERKEPDNKRYFFMKNHVIDNRWIVPYNPYLSKKYNCHLNIEICSSIRSIKYLFKYIHKGFDCANIKFDTLKNGELVWDEVQAFLASRYLSAPEAAWRLLKKTMHDKSHTVIRLPVHLSKMQPVYFQDKFEAEAIEKASLQFTELTGWFDLNSNDPRSNDFLYPEIPNHYLWVNKKWQKRVYSGENIISRMHAVDPKNSELYHLRMLLSHVRGAKSYEDIRFYNNVTYSSFKEACLARNLLQDDKEWLQALRDACIVQMPSQLRQLFVIICAFCNPTSPLELWNNFEQDFIEDFAHTMPISESKRQALQHIQSMLQMHSLTLEGLNLPTPSHYDSVDVLNEYDCEHEEQEGFRLKQMLNSEQTTIFDTVIEAVTSQTQSPKLFSVNAFAGAGKSFLFNAIMHAVRGMGKIAIPVAWTGIAATLLKGGRTACSTFKLPIPLTETSSCRIKVNSDDRKRIQAATIIIWDECTMTSRFALNAVDHYLRDMTDSVIPFGGKVVLLGGDWRQILPIEFHGAQSVIIQNCLKNSNSWPLFKQFTLHTNMRTLPSEKKFAEWLIKLGDGTLQSVEAGLTKDAIEIPEQCVTTNSIIDEVFGYTIDQSNMHLMGNKSILCVTNDVAMQLNEEVLDRVPGDATSYYSADKIESEDGDDVSLYSMEFINSQTPSGMPPYHLRLKPGVIIMLLRNLNPSQGLCNGSRLIVKQLMNNVIDAEVLVGDHKGKRFFIPRIQISPSDSNLPFKLIRRQFPIRLSFAMTINKSQGQSLQTVGIYLDRPVFSHGQLYVAFSRATSIDSVHVFVNPTQKQGQLLDGSSKTFTQNVVFREVFQM